MGYIVKYAPDGIEFYIDDIGVFYNGPNLLFTKEQIESLSGEQLVWACRWFAKNKRDIAAIELYNYGAKDFESNVEQLALYHQERYIRERAAQMLKKNKPAPKPPREYGSEWVYLVGNESEGKYKIGMTRRTPNERLSQFTPQLPFSTTLIAAIETDEASKLERKLHKAYANKRVNGEWFELEPDDVAYIKGLANG